MSDTISPYSWPEILDRFPLDYRTWRSISRDKVPAGRRVREFSDKAAQYGDLLEHGDTYVSVGASAMITFSSSASSANWYTIAGISSGSTQVSFSPSDITATT